MSSHVSLLNVTASEQSHGTTTIVDDDATVSDVESHLGEDNRSEVSSLDEPAGFQHATSTPSIQRSRKSLYTTQNNGAITTTTMSTKSAPQITVTEHLGIDHDNFIRPGIHWRAPTLMIATFLMGVALALGHHFFYVYCDGTFTDDLLSQKWVIRIGTGFAFLVKLCFATLIGIAYVQQLWISLPQRPEQIQGIDGMFSILRDALQFRYIGVWYRNPILFLMAVVAWLVPFAAIVTPGTMTVTTMPSAQLEPIPVPQLVFNGYSYASIVTNATGSFYAGPTNDLYRTALATATQNQVLQLPSRRANMTYELKFTGPGISCEPGNNDTRLLNQQCFGQQITDTTVPYFAYVPGNSGDQVNCTTDKFASLDSSSRNSARLFVSAANTWLQCSLMAYDYHLNFTFAYPNQTIDVISAIRSEGVNGLLQAIPSEPLQAPELNHLSYQAIMDAFGRLMVGKDTRQGWSITNMQPTLFHSILPPLVFSDTSTNGQVQTVVEELFRNVTFSLFSSNAFTNFTSNTSEAHNVTVLTWISIQRYSYHPRDLFIAYGIATLVSAVCLAIGIVALLRNNASYSSDFSTIVRTTRSSEIDALVQRTDASRKGADPLPHEMAKDVISFHTVRGASQSERLELKLWVGRR